MKISKRLKLPALVVVALGIGASSTAWSAAAGNSSTALNLTGQLAVLSYYSNLAVNLPLTQLAPTNCTADTANDFECANTALRTRTTTRVGGELRANFNPVSGLLNVTFPVNLISAPLILQNVWAVRTIGGTGFFAATSTLTLAVLNTGTPLGNGASQIGLQGLASGLIHNNTSGVIGNNTLVTGFTDAGLVNARTGSVRINLNFLNTTLNGNHTRAGAEYRLTLTNL